MQKGTIKDQDKNLIAGTYDRYNMVAASGKGVVCTDEDGKEYIDFSSGIGVNSLGFCDDEWIEAVTAQLKKLQHISNLYYTEPQVKVAQILTERTGMNKVFLANSGAEANEAAIKTARKYYNQKTGSTQNEIITLKNSFHGRTMAAITATGQENYHKNFYPFLGGFVHSNPNDLEDLRQKMTNNTCAVMMELIQGEGGVVNLSADFVKDTANLCKEKGILLIIDEVQTGIGRTGHLFAYEHFGIKPDIVTFAKGIGGGLPLGGVLLGEKVSEVLSHGDHGTTYGGNPVVCAGALVVLSRLNDDFLTEVKEKSAYLIGMLKSIPQVVSVSGMGLMLGVEIKGNQAKKIVEKALKNGLLLITAKDKIRLLPPLTITFKELEAGVRILENILK